MRVRLYLTQEFIQSTLSIRKCQRFIRRIVAWSKTDWFNKLFTMCVMTQTRNQFNPKCVWKNDKQRMLCKKGQQMESNVTVQYAVAIDCSCEHLMATNLTHIYHINISTRLERKYGSLLLKPKKNGYRNGNTQMRTIKI